MSKYKRVRISASLTYLALALSFFSSIKLCLVLSIVSVTLALIITPEVLRRG
jgi:hypothetical protein